MILIKKKSLLVALLSSLLLSTVLVLTLIGYVVYLEIKDRELKSSYEYQLGEIRRK